MATMQNVQLPDGRVVQLPMELTPEQAQSIMQQYGGGGSVPAAPTSVPEIQLPQPSIDDMRAAYKASPAGLEKKALGEQIDALQRQLKQQELGNLRTQAESGGLLDKAKYVGTLMGDAAMRGLATLPASFATAGIALDPMRFKGVATPDMPMDSVAGIGALPETRGEKYLSGITEGVTSGIASPGRLVANALTGAASGVGAELGASLAGDSPVGRIVGALVGGGGSTAALGAGSNARARIADAVRHVPDEDFETAKQLRDTLNELEIPFFSSQLLGERSTMPDVIGVAGTNPAVRPRLLSHVSEAPQAAHGAIERWGMSNLTPTTDEIRGTLSNVQLTAQRRLDDLRQAANAEYTRALPPGLSEEFMDPAVLQQGIAMFREAAADPNFAGRFSSGGKLLEGIANELEEAAKTGLPVQKGEINNLLKTLRTRTQEPGFAGVSTATAEDILKKMTPEFQPARDAMSAYMKKHVEPVQRSIVGDLAGMGGGVRADKFTARKTAITNVFDAQFPQKAEIDLLGRELGGEAVGDLLREHVTRTLNSSIQKAAGSSKQQQPFNFVKNLVGNEAKATNVFAALDIVSKDLGADPKLVREGFRRMLDALETTQYQKLPANIDSASFAHKAGFSVLGASIALHSRLGRTLWDRATERTLSDIVDIVLAPDAIEQMQQLARSPQRAPFQAFAQSVLVTALDKQAMRDRAEAEGDKSAGIMPQ